METNGNPEHQNELPKLPRFPRKMIICAGKAIDQGFLVQPMGFAEIIKGACVVSQLSVDKTNEKVRIHRFEGFQIHDEAVNKAESS